MMLGPSSMCRMFRLLAQGFFKEKYYIFVAYIIGCNGFHAIRSQHNNNKENCLLKSLLGHRPISIG